MRTKARLSCPHYSYVFSEASNTQVDPNDFCDIVHLDLVALIEFLRQPGRFWYI